MSKELRKSGLGASLRAFHEDEAGMETLQIVMIVGIAAIILIALKISWKDKIEPWLRDKLDKVKEE